jgi:hypothetical protein
MFHPLKDSPNPFAGDEDGRLSLINDLLDTVSAVLCPPGDSQHRVAII